MSEQIYHGCLERGSLKIDGSPVGQEALTGAQQPRRASLKINLARLPGDLHPANLSYVGQTVVMIPAIQSGRSASVDLAADGGGPLNWIVEMTGVDGDGASQVARVAHQECTADSANGWARREVMQIRSVTTSGDGETMVVGAVSDDQDFANPVAGETMPGLGTEITFSEATAESAAFRAEVPHSEELEPDQNFIVSVIFRVDVKDGTPNIILIKGSALANGLACWAFHTTPNDALRFRFHNAAGSLFAADVPAEEWETGKLLHAFCLWDGANVHVQLGENRFTGSAVTTAYVGNTDPLAFGRNPALTQSLNGAVTYCAIASGYGSFPTAEDLIAGLYAPMDPDLHGAAVKAEWGFDEGAGMTSTNLTTPGYLDVVMTNTVNPDHDPWRYSGTGPVGAAGTPWPFVLGWAEVEPVYGHEGLSTAVYHVTAPAAVSGVHLWAVDRITVAGSQRNVRIREEQSVDRSITWQPRWIRDDESEANYGRQYLSPYLGLADGSSITITGNPAINGTYKVERVERSNARWYGRALLIDASTPLPGTGSGTATISQETGSVEVEWDGNGNLEFSDRPAGKIVASVIVGIHPISQAKAPLEVPSLGSITSTLISRAGASLSAAAADEIKALTAGFFGADPGYMPPWELQFTPAGINLAGMTYRDAVTVLMNSIGVGWGWAAANGVIDAAPIRKFQPTDPVAGRFDDGNTISIEAVRTVPPYQDWEVLYDRTVPHAPSDVGAGTMEAMSARDRGRITTEWRRKRPSGYKPGAVRVDRQEHVTALLLDHQARQRANAAANLFSGEAVVYAVTVPLAACNVKERRSYVEVRSARHAGLSDWKKAQVLSVAKTEKTATIHVLTW